MPFATPDKALPIFLKEKGYGLDEYHDSAEKQAEFELWYPEYLKRK